MSDGLLIIAGLLTIAGLLDTLSRLDQLQKGFECSAGFSNLVDTQNIKSFAKKNAALHAHGGRRSFLLATTANIRQIESVMHLHLKSEKSEHRQLWATEALSEGESVECRHGPARPQRQPIGLSCRLHRRRRTID